MTGAAVPEPFEPLPELEGFVARVGPLYWIPDRRNFAVGFRVAEHHVNVGGVVHGGMLMTVADMTLALGTRVLAELDAFFPTIQMSCDFLEPGRAGDWIEGRARVLRRTRRMAFTTCTLSTGERILLRATGVMKIAQAGDERFRVPGDLRSQAPRER